MHCYVYFYMIALSTYIAKYEKKLDETYFFPYNNTDKFD